MEWTISFKIYSSSGSGSSSSGGSSGGSDGACEISLKYKTLHITPHHTTLHYTTLHYTTLHTTYQENSQPTMSMQLQLLQH